MNEPRITAEECLAQLERLWEQAEKPEGVSTRDIAELKGVHIKTARDWVAAAVRCRLWQLTGFRRSQQMNGRSFQEPIYCPVRAKGGKA